MIKALETGSAGQVVVLGLTGRNLELLAADQPIRCQAAEVGVRPSFDIWILGGATTGSVAEDLRAVGLATPEDADTTGGLLRFYAARWAGPVRRGGPHLDVAVLGVSTVAARALAGGEVFELLVPGRAVTVRLLAAATIYAVADRIASGRTPQVLIDLTGGHSED